MDRRPYHVRLAGARTVLRRIAAFALILIPTFPACAPLNGQSAQRLRIGIDTSPPYTYVDSTGRPGGLAVDLLNEAARRRHIAIEWVPVEGGGIDALARGVVDLWPVVEITPDPFRQFHITDAWFRNDFQLVSRRDRPILDASDTAGRTVVHTDRPLAIRTARRALQKARLQPAGSSAAVLEQVCNGSAAAGFLEARALDALLLDRPPACEEIALEVRHVKDAVAFAGIGASLRYATLADDLYREIARMVSDETSFGSRSWTSYPAEEMRALLAFRRDRNGDQPFFRGFVISLCVSLAAGALLIYALYTRAGAVRARSLEAIRSDVLRRLAAGASLREILGVLAATVSVPWPALRCSIRTADGVIGIAVTDEPRSSWPIMSSGGQPLGEVTVSSRALRPRHRDLLTRVAELAAIVIDHRVLQKELEHEATHDRLTGLPNRRVFNERLAALECDRRKDRRSTLFFVDLDRFKQINDALGHHIGDQFLREAARRMLACFRSGDLVARIGGDEFVILAGGLSAEDVRRVSAHLVERFRQPFAIQDRPIFATISVGVSSWPADAATVADLQVNADAALYEAKEHGRDQFRIFTPAMRDRITARLWTERLLHQALDENLLSLFYQPQVSADGREVGLEALVRIIHPQHGLILPGAFVGAAEETGLIGQIDRWVLEQACRQYLAWRSEGLDPPRISINLSRCSLANAGIAEEILACLAATGVPARAIQIELTESAALTGGDASRDALRQLSQAGISLALDDFGTGYSSLSCLHDLPVNAVKIDRAFIQNLTDDTRSLPLVQAMVAAARALGMDVVAEGVATARQLEFLTAMGCAVFQGHFISPPVPASELMLASGAGQAVCAEEVAA